MASASSSGWAFGLDLIVSEEACANAGNRPDLLMSRKQTNLVTLNWQVTRTVDVENSTRRQSMSRRLAGGPEPPPSYDALVFFCR